ncbi:MAG: MoaD family protein [Nitrososphaerales archaeon]|jgi:adenylyltransferase/sulfurtransferase|nr:MoaD family protein [Nitrososphaerales archaeon]|tara:strand:+ start:487 stop:768 length:282 start_codon:yes stop_codon:yes gene_type:complete
MAKIKFTIPGVLASITEGNREIDMDASTVGDAVSFLVSKYGEEFERRILDPTGQPKRLLNFYVNGKNIRFLSNFETKLNNGDVVMLLPAVGGG